MAKTGPFDNHLFEYEKWFDDNYYVFLSELEAIKKIIPSTGNGVEIGVGSGKFAYPLGITEGCDPSSPMRKKAAERGINAINGIAEKLPYPNEKFNFALMVTTICFVDDVQETYQEIYRVLKPEGEVITGFVDKNSPVGQQYLQHKEKSLFYKEANFFSTEEIYQFLIDNGFEITETYQTVFGNLKDIEEVQQPENGSGKGSFVVIKAKKINKKPIRFAFAVNHEGMLQRKHFGDADKYIIYEWANDEMAYVNEIINAAKDYDEEQEHGSRKKGMAVSGLLKKEGVKVLVSMQFGKNIQIVNNHFIPVIVYSEDLNKAVPVFSKHMECIEDELNNKSEKYKVFTIKEGVLKSIIKKEE